MKWWITIMTAVLGLVPLSVSAAPPVSEKRFQSGVSGLGYRWNFCREGEVVRYVVFAHGARPREMGESKPGTWVEVNGAGSRNPKATLVLTAKERQDLFAAGDRIYQISQDGKLTTYEERVTEPELRAFMESYPKQYTAQALLAFVHARRAVRE